MYEDLMDLYGVVDERHTDVYYNGGVSEDEDIYDYIDVKEVLAYV